MIPQSWSMSLSLTLPEVTLAAGAMTLLLLGVVRGDRSLPLLTWLAVGVYALAALFSYHLPPDRLTAFGDLFVTDGYARFLKLAIYGAAAVASLLALPFWQQAKAGRFEYPVIILLATTGMSMMVSANDLIALYIGLELQSLSLYILASFHREQARSAEAGLKYFVLGALSSGLLLYGASLIYGFAGTTNFEGLRTVLHGSLAHPAPTGVLFGMIFVLIGLGFKVSAVPFHMWTPDVYEGAPTPVTALFASAPKVAAMGLLVRVAYDAFGGLHAEWQQIVMALSALSMLLGALAALGQTNIKRLLAYSSIGHMGYVLLALAAGGWAGVRAILVYLAIYVVTTIASFLCVLAMNRDATPLEDIHDLGGLGKRQPLMALALTLTLFSLAGVPPLSGFFAKYYAFQAAINTGEPVFYGLAVFGVLTSVVAAGYYLRLIKIMYFDAAVADFDRSPNTVNNGLLAGTALLVSPVGLLLLGPLVTAAGVAASALVGGG